MSSIHKLTLREKTKVQTFIGSRKQFEESLKVVERIKNWCSFRLLPVERDLSKIEISLLRKLKITILTFGICYIILEKCAREIQ